MWAGADMDDGVLRGSQCMIGILKNLRRRFVCLGLLCRDTWSGRASERIQSDVPLGDARCTKRVRGGAG
jgi:hypothetical protein